MPATTRLQTTSFYAVLSDPNNPARGFDYHVNYVEVTTYDDGLIITTPEKQCNSTKAIELGLNLGPLADVLNFSAQAAREAADAKVTAREATIETLQGELAQAITVAEQAIRERNAALAAKEG